MPKLIKELICGEEVENVFRNPQTGTYYLRKFDKRSGELVKSLRVKKFRSADQARRKRDEVWQKWSGFTQTNQIGLEEIALMAVEHKKGRSPRTLEEFVYTWSKHLRPYFANMEAGRVGAEWNLYVNESKLKNPSRKVDRDAKTMRFILGVAVNEGLLSTIPKLEVPLSDKEVRLGRLYSNEQIQKLLDSASLKWQVFIELGLMGLRYGTIRQLKFEHFNYSDGLISIPPEITKRRKTWIVPISNPDFYPLLTRWRAEISRRRTPTYVFPHRTRPGACMGPSDKSWQRLKERAGLSGMTFHDLRHTVASRALSAGHSTALVGKNFAMSDRILKQRYFHLQEEKSRQIMADLHTSFRKNSESEKSDGDLECNIN